MTNVLYEASFEFDFIFLIPIFMLGFIAVFPKIMKDSYKNIKIDLKIIKRVCSVAFMFVSIFSLIVALSQYHMYSNTVGAYNNGEYEIVEGYVENFEPMPYEGHSIESFEINGVYFSYSDYNVIQGYNNSKSHGGVITENGQHLKIGYVNYDNSNIIVYIEEII